MLQTIYAQIGTDSVRPSAGQGLFARLRARTTGYDVLFPCRSAGMARMAEALEASAARRERGLFTLEHGPAQDLCVTHIGPMRGEFRIDGIREGDRPFAILQDAAHGEDGELLRVPMSAPFARTAREAGAGGIVSLDYGFSLLRMRGKEASVMVPAEMIDPDVAPRHEVISRSPGPAADPFDFSMMDRMLKGPGMSRDGRV